MFGGTGSYADASADVTWTTTENGHSMGEVFMAAMHAGLAVTHLEEHTSMTFDPRGLDGSGLDEDGRLRIGQRRLEGESHNDRFRCPSDSRCWPRQAAGGRRPAVGGRRSAQLRFRRLLVGPGT